MILSCSCLALSRIHTQKWKRQVNCPGACPTKYRIDQIRSNSNFAWNSYRCAFEDSRPIITKFGTRHDSRTVVTCTKFRYDRPTIIEIRGTRIFSKFWIRSNLSIRYLVGQAPGLHWGRWTSPEMIRAVTLITFLLQWIDEQTDNILKFCHLKWRLLLPSLTGQYGHT